MEGNYKEMIMMDELKLKLTTKFMKNMVAKWVAKTIRKKYGYSMNIQLNEIDISSFNGNTDVKLNVEIKLDSDEFKKIMEQIGLD